MKIHERINDGIKRGVIRHWRFTKNLLRIKPEYLLTVSVADALTDGFDNIHGLDLEIKLEEPTKAISGDLLIKSVGLQNYFKSPKHKVKRKGKVDIYVEHNEESWILELKGFDPTVPEINKEIIRLVEFLNVNGGSNNCKGCFLAFPTSSDKKKWIEKKLANIKGMSSFHVAVFNERVETGEEEGDGIPVYYANCISITIP